MNSNANRIGGQPRVEWLRVNEMSHPAHAETVALLVDAPNRLATGGGFMLNHMLMVIDKADLMKAPKGVVKTLLGAAKISNELNAATKYFHFARNGLMTMRDGDIASNSAALSIWFYALKMVAGHALEGSNFLGKQNIRDMINSQTLRNDLDFKLSWKTINKYFNSPNDIFTIRQKLSFHTDGDFLFQALKETDTDFQFAMILGEVYGHTIFAGIDKIVGEKLALLGRTGEAPDGTFAASLHEVLRITDHIGHVMQKLIAHICHDVLKIDSSGGMSLSTPEGPPIDTVSMPFFCMPPVAQSG